MSAAWGQLDDAQKEKYDDIGKAGTVSFRKRGFAYRCKQGAHKAKCPRAGQVQDVHGESGCSAMAQAQQLALMVVPPARSVLDDYGSLSSDLIYVRSLKPPSGMPRRSLPIHVVLRRLVTRFGVITNMWVFLRSTPPQSRCRWRCFV